MQKAVAISMMTARNGARDLQGVPIIGGSDRLSDAVHRERAFDRRSSQSVVPIPARVKFRSDSATHLGIPLGQRNRHDREAAEKM